MTEGPSFQRELARTRHSPERVYGLLIWALAISGVGGYGLLKDGPSAAGYGAGALGAVLLVTAGLLLALHWRRLQVAFALLDKGAAAEGTVTAIRKRGFLQGLRRPLRVPGSLRAGRSRPAADESGGGVHLARR